MALSWTMSSWNETNVYKNISAVITTSCESFNHAMRLYNPKSLNIKETEYLDNLYACYVAYTMNQQICRRHRTVLKHNKSQDTSVATNSRKRGNDSPHVVYALKNTLSEDDETQRGVRLAEMRMKKLQEDRGLRKDVYESAVRDGNSSGIELSYQVAKCRPCAPFPFKSDDMLEMDSTKKEQFLKMLLLNNLVVKEMEAKSRERILKTQQEAVDLYNLCDSDEAEVEAMELS